MKLVEREQLAKLDYIEDQYKDAMDMDKLIEDTFRFDSRNNPNIPKMPEDDHWPAERFDVDHIIAIVNGGEQWDEKNLQVLCQPCHKKKTKKDMELSRKH